MLSFFNNPSPRRYCDGLSRRGFIKAGTLAVGGLALCDLLKLKAHGAIAPNRSGKSVIMICLGGGPSHIDTYDMKPDAPAEFRGEFRQAVAQGGFFVGRHSRTMTRSARSGNGCRRGPCRTAAVKPTLSPRVGLHGAGHDVSWLYRSMIREGSSL